MGSGACASGRACRAWLHHARLDGSGHAGARRFGVAARPFAEIGGRRRPGGCFLKGRRPLGPTSRPRRDHHGRQWPLGGGPRRCAARRAPPGGRGGAPHRARRARARHPAPDAVRVFGAELGAARGRGGGADAAPRPVRARGARRAGGARHPADGDRRPRAPAGVRARAAGRAHRGDAREPGHDAVPGAVVRRARVVVRAAQRLAQAAVAGRLRPEAITRATSRAPSTRARCRRPTW